jgi:gliding motility-associated-like protein
VYDWSPGIWLSDSTIAMPLAVPLDTIDYVLITTDQYGCFTIDSIHVIVNPLPTLTVSPYPDTAICEGDTIQLNAIGNGIGFLWTPAAGLDNPNSPTPLASPAQTITYEAYTVDGNGCSNRDTVRVVVNRFFTNFLVERVCLGDRTDIVDVSTTSDLPISTWQWDFGDLATTGDISSNRNPNYTYPDSGNYTVTLVLTDVIGCTDTLQQIARVDHPAEPEAWPDTIICFGDAIQLTARGGDTIYWTPAIDIDNPNSFTPTVSPQVTTTYVANITYGVCPFNTARVEVRVNPTPQLDVEPVFEILRGDSVVLTTLTGLYDTIFWEPDTFLSCNNCASPLAKPDSTTVYNVTVIDSLGCVNTKEVRVVVEVKCTEDQIFVGNGFTPNNDGVNDVAYARLQGLKRLIIYRIFDRWGALVFETNDPFNGWDGKNSKGEQLNSGVYVYMVEAECFNGQTLIKTGNVTIIK